MYALINKDTQIVLSLTESHVAAVASGKDYVEVSVYDLEPTVGMIFDKKTDTFKHLTVVEVREIRNKMLRDTDWRATVDYPNADQAAWKTYRQKLRDLPQDYPDMVGLVFPVEPNADQ